MRKKISLALLTFVLLFMASIGINAISVGMVSASSTVNLTASPNDWTVSNMAFDETSMYLTNTGNAISPWLDGAQPVSIKMIGSLTDETAGWYASWIVFKSTDAEMTKWHGFTDATATEGVGNWLAFRYGRGVALPSIVGCKDGVISSIFTFSEAIVNGNDFDSTYKTITDIEIISADTETGIEFEIVYKSNSAAGRGTPYSTGKIAVANPKLKGEHRISIGYFGAGAFNKDAGIHYIVNGAKSLAVVDPEDEFVNLATDAKYWKAGHSSKMFRFDDNGVYLRDVGKAGIVLNGKVEANSKFSIQFNNTIDPTPWGNMYIVFKNTEQKARFSDAPASEKSGNYLVFAFGSDGCFFYDIKDGIETKIDITNPTPPQTLPSGVNNNDLWHWFSQSPKVTIQTTDNEQGVKVDVIFAGSSSSWSTSYQSTNTNIKGSYYVSTEIFTAHLGTEIKNIRIKSFKIWGKETFTVADIDVAKLNTDIAAAITSGINQDNMVAIRSLVDKATADMGNMSLADQNVFQTKQYDILKSAITAYEASVQKIAAVDALIAALPQTVTSENKADFTAAFAAYDALSAVEQAAITKKAELDSANAKVMAYETSTQKIAAVDALIAVLPQTVTSENKANFTAAFAAYDELSAVEQAAIAKKAELDSAKIKVASFEAGLLTDTTAANTVKALFDALPITINKDNADSAKLSIKAAEDAFALLTENQKTLVTNKDKLTAAKTALNTYEVSQKNNGCKSHTSGNAVSIVFVALAALWIVKKSNI